MNGPPRPTAARVEVVVVGGGQSGLAAGYHLRRAGLRPGREFLVLDSGGGPGGAWRHGWPSLHLFSPPAYSSLPGWLMPGHADDYLPATHVIDYLTRYEKRYDLAVRRGIRVVSVSPVGPVSTVREQPTGRLEVATDDGRRWSTRVVVSATGTWGRPFVPRYPGQDAFGGVQRHSADYTGPGPYAGRRVLLVGGGNTAAQLLAELSTVAETTWVTRRPPHFLPDEVDGRALFDIATARRRALDAAPGQPVEAAGRAGLGDIVMVDTVRAARDRGALNALPMFESLTSTGARWRGGAERPFDVVLWCTGYRPDLAHLAPLRLARRDGHPDTVGTRARSDPRVHLLGYGDWTGPASATLIGVGRPAKEMAAEVMTLLAGSEPRL